ncbi:MAG: hypothetical protein C5B53_08155 [Candidatus Melainabacteria bacterium]|nr:MAG: hypothetical protein C5B53_08155 [Candidatus Melainabacteria bacterium]
MNQKKDDLRIGEFLVEAQLIHPYQLAKAIEDSQTEGLPVGRVLVMMGQLSELDLRSAIKVQSLVRDSIIPFHIAVKGLSLASKEKIDVDLALAYLGWVDAGHFPTNKLGELLLEAGIIDSEHLNTALRNSQATGLPLGRILVTMGMISSDLLATALNAQLFVRDATVTRKQAVDGLKAAKARRSEVENLLKQQGFASGVLPKNVRLGQLFRTAEIIEEDNLWKSLADVLSLKKAIGEILSSGKLIEQDLLRTALTLQEMIANRTLNNEQAVTVLGNVHGKGRSLELALAFLEIPEQDLKTTVRFHELLTVCNMVDNQSLEYLPLNSNVEAGSADAFKTAEILLSHSVLSEHLCYGALRCYFLVATGWLNVEQAVLAMNQFKRRQISFDEVLQILKWAAKTYVLN